MTRPWSAGAATGIGSMPGEDPLESIRLIFGELPGLPHLAELPARGAGSDTIGRTASVLIDLPVEIDASRWRFTAHPGREMGRARDFLARDLDALELAAQGYHGPLKLQIAGPWTLASEIELPGGHKVVSDHGATRDLAESLAEGIRVHVSDVASRVPGAALVVQVDEPGLTAVLAGQVPTPSGFGTVRSIDAVLAQQTLRTVLQAAPPGGRVVHSCAPDVPIAMLCAAGADAISIDFTQLGGRYQDALAEAVDVGVSLWLGILPSTDAEIRLDEAGEAISRLWRELGAATRQLASCVVPTPACGLANASPAHVRHALAGVRELGRRLLQE